MSQRSIVKCTTLDSLEISENVDVFGSNLNGKVTKALVKVKKNLSCLHVATVNMLMRSFISSTLSAWLLPLADSLILSAAAKQECNSVL